jgi:hypothetical protein
MQPARGKGRRPVKGANSAKGANAANANEGLAPVFAAIPSGPIGSARKWAKLGLADLTSAQGTMRFPGPPGKPPPPKPPYRPACIRM